MKTVYLPVTPAATHSMYKIMLANPVPGYRFVTREDHSAGFPAHGTAPSPNPKRLKSIYSALIGPASYAVRPKVLIALKEHLENRKKMEACDMVYSPNGMPVWVNKPWVTDTETVYTSFVGAGLRFSYAKLRMHKRSIERMLSSANCKKIMPYCDMGRKNLLAVLDCRGFEEKIETVYFGIRSRKVRRDFGGEKVNILFVDSGNVGYEGQFYSKGGEEAVLSYLRLRKKHRNATFTIRSSRIPPRIMEMLAGKKDIRIITQRLKQEELDCLFLQSDILFAPYFNVSVVAFMEGMDWCLPIVTMDGWGNREAVTDGVNGFVVGKSRFYQAYDSDYSPTPQEKRTVDPNQVESYVRCLSELAEKPDLREKMGLAGKKLVEPGGKFSIQVRNRNLKRIFDEALE